METLVGLLGTCRTAALDLAGLPARHLASFMDDADEVWLVDSFLDQPDGSPRCPA